MLKITGVEKYKGSTMRIDFESGETAFINAETAAKYSLRAGLDIPKSAWEQIVRADTFRRAKERALYLLDYRDHSYAELFEKLSRNYDEDICYGVCDKLSSMGLVDDRRYAAALARKYMEVKRYGRFRAAREMRQKGIPSELIDEYLDKYEDTVQERLEELISRKYIRRLEDGEDGVKKVRAALVRMGYSYRDVNEALDSVLEELENDGGDPQ